MSAIKIYEEFLSKSKIFSSVEEIVKYKKLWPVRNLVSQSLHLDDYLQQKTQFYVGLDVSSRSTGLCVLNNKLNVLTCKAIKPTTECKSNSLLTASFIFSHLLSEFNSINKEYNSELDQWHITIEKYLQMFNASSFRTQGLFYLAEINGIIQYKCWEHFNALPTLIHPSTARSLLDLKSEGNREDTKNGVFKYVRDTTKNQIQWPLKTRSKGYSDECYDMADAYVLARAGMIECIVNEYMTKWNIDNALHGDFQNSPFISEICKINIAHYIRKHLDDKSMMSLSTLPKSLIDKYILKLRKITEECVASQLAMKEE